MLDTQPQFRIWTFAARPFVRLPSLDTTNLPQRPLSYGRNSSAMPYVREAGLTTGTIDLILPGVPDA